VIYIVSTGNVNIHHATYCLGLVSVVNLALNGTASQSSVYHWENQNLNLTADLAITGEPTHDFNNASCSTTLTNPKQYVAWWMLTFPVDTIYITNVKIYYRYNSKYSLSVSQRCRTRCIVKVMCRFTSNG
jgi:hypothetical protein